MQPLLDLVEGLGLAIRSLIHVGAHDGQEIGAYRRLGIERALFVEALPEVHARLQRNLAGQPGYAAILALCAAEDGSEATFFEADNAGGSSSLLLPSRHLERYPQVRFPATHRMTTRRLDTAVAEVWGEAAADLIVLDVQGAEEVVLRGAPRLLAGARAIIAEIAEEALYEGGATRESLERFLQEQGFDRRAVIANAGYGDALFLRRGLALAEPPAPKGPNLALGRHACQSNFSIYSRGIHEAGLAVNGEVTGSYAFHTPEEEQPWWMVDLGAKHPIEEITVYNRIDACAERGYGVQVLASPDGERWTLLHEQAGRPFGGADGRPLRVRPGRLVARFIRVKLPGTGILHLDQVEVHGLA